MDDGKVLKKIDMLGAEKAASDSYSSYEEDDAEAPQQRRSAFSEASTGTLRWSAVEHEHIERGSDWFWALGVIAASAALTAILFGNVLFALLIVVAALTIGLIARKPPEMHEFEISEKGIRIGQAFHPYDTVISFWVDEELEKPLLLIDTTTFMSPNLIIPVAEMLPETIREAMRPHATEVPMKEPTAHKILEFFGF